MSVLSVQISTTGQVPNTSGLGIGMTQQSPTPIFINTNDTLATVLTTGYLNQSHTDFQYPYNNYQLAEVYTTDNGTVWLRVEVTTSGATSTYSLVSPSESGTITSPTVTNQIAYATNTSATLAASGLATALFNAGNISAGTSGTAGSLESYPATSSKGALIVKAVANTGNTNVTISNAAFGQGTVMSFADVGAATGNFLDTGVAMVSGNFPMNSGTAGLMVDSAIPVNTLATYTGATVTGNIAKFANTTGELSDSGVSITSTTANPVQVLTSTVTLTAAQVIAAYATPELLIPAVAGKVAVIISAIVYTSVSTAFTTGVAPIIQYANTAHGAGTIATGTGLVTGDITAASSQIRTLGAAASTTYTGITDVGIYFSCTTAYAVGTGSTVTFQLVYTYLTATV